VSAFDDEFGLFGDEAGDGERKSTLGARNIDTKESTPNDVDFETAPPPRGRGPRSGGAGFRDRGPRERDSRPPVDPVASAKRATAVLEYMAKKLVAKPDDVTVDLFADEDGKPVIELVVDPEDLGKVIGRNGRVAQALRTIVRATAEGRISVDILDSEEAAEGFDDDQPAD
jgi:predicted RNA-binding protein YlqC (UPF0109 family)